MRAVEAGDLLYERQGRVAWVTFNRPDARNAMTFDMYDDLHDLCDRIDKDPEVRVVVVRGAGEKSFAAGTDIRQFLDFETREDALGYEARIGRVLRRLSAVTKPTIAMVQGDAVGGGLFLSLACDLRFAAEHARFGAPVARTLGNCTAPFSFTLLASTVGMVRAREILLRARLVGAAEARTIGLADEVYAAPELEARVREQAERLTEHAPLTMAAVKEASRRVRDAFALDNAEDIILSCYLSQDFKEGARAFLEKRKPNWRGV
jgi:enoyl-CoA hydratase/carnithine racemase